MHSLIPAQHTLLTLHLLTAYDNLADAKDIPLGLHFGSITITVTQRMMFRFFFASELPRRGSPLNPSSCSSSSAPQFGLPKFSSSQTCLPDPGSSRGRRGGRRRRQAGRRRARGRGRRWPGGWGRRASRRPPAPR